jgi:translation initiation factor IF-3
VQRLDGPNCGIAAIEHAMNLRTQVNADLLVIAAGTQFRGESLPET